MGLKESMSYPATRNRMDNTEASMQPGDEDTTSAAALVATADVPATTPSGTAVTIETVQEKHFADLARLQKDFLNSKYMCCCIPLGSFSTEAEVQKTFKKCPAMMDVGAVALVEGEAVGFIQVLLHGMPCDIHTVEKDEAYVYMIAVDPDARGMGVGRSFWPGRMKLEDNMAARKLLWMCWMEIKPLGFINERGIRFNPHPFI